MMRWDLSGHVGLITSGKAAAVKVLLWSRLRLCIILLHRAGHHRQRLLRITLADDTLDLWRDFDRTV